MEFLHDLIVTPFLDPFTEAQDVADKFLGIMDFQSYADGAIGQVLNYLVGPE
ncbi:MAG: hypothetical protein WCQ50_15380 [Spirochaetota bacterium]